MPTIKHLIVGLGLWLLAVLPGHSTVLFVGGEDVNFAPNIACGSNCVTTTEASAFRSAWARSAMRLSSITAGDPPVVRLITPNFTASQTVWLHGQFCHGGNVTAGCDVNNTTTANQQWVRFIDDNGNAALVVRGTGTDNQVKISSRTAGGVFTDLVTCNNAFGALLGQVDMKMTLALAGEATLYFNSVQVCQFLGDTRNGDGSTHFQTVELSSPWLNATSGFTGYWSEVIVADTDTRPYGLFTMYPNGAGALTQWNGTNGCSAIVNNNPFNDFSFIAASGNNLTEDCAIYQTLPMGVFSVPAIGMSARAQVGFTGPQHFDFVTRVSGTDYYSSDRSPVNTFSNIGNYIQSVNPATTLPFTTSDITDVGFQAGVISRP